jgi:transcriptional regulator with XRE-family HTH domain
MFKTRLLDLRKAKGWTQNELAERLGLSNGLIAAYELGTKKPAQDTLIAIADFFGCTLDYLCGRAEA